MKKILILILLSFVLTGCATYKFRSGEKPYEGGYVASRDGYTIAEYTLGENDAPPGDLAVAKERFRRRRKHVEHYYKKMGYVENRFKMAVWNPIVYTLKTFRGILRLPFVAISDYRYEHNPAYREKVDRKEDERELREEVNIQKLKEKLYRYVQQDIALESQEAGLRTPQVSRSDSQAVSGKLTRKEEKLARREERRRLKKNISISRSAKTDAPRKPVAVIIAKPARGYSPLRVRFYGHKSRVKGSKIVSYYWDFGDGDTSTQKNPTNTYYSGTFDPQFFDATLTVRDNQGNAAHASTIIEVLNK